MPGELAFVRRLEQEEQARGRPRLSAPAGSLSHRACAELGGGGKQVTGWLGAEHY